MAKFRALVSFSSPELSVYKGQVIEIPENKLTDSLVKSNYLSLITDKVEIPEAKAKKTTRKATVKE